MAKKGQSFLRYTVQIKANAVRLVLEENCSYHVATKLGIRNKIQVHVLVKKVQQGEREKKPVFQDVDRKQRLQAWNKRWLTVYKST